MCPYARFQGVMFDSNTLIVTYDQARGEPRGKGARNAEVTTPINDDDATESLGDCVDCGVCVTVCPVGIDIRDGLQYECISCAACVDACNDVMTLLNKPTGLIRYATENVINGATHRLVSSRFIGYAVAVMLIAGLLVFQLTHREPLEISLTRDRQALYNDMGGGVIENTYYLKVSNKGQEQVAARISISGVRNYSYLSLHKMSLAANETNEAVVRIQMHVDNLDTPNTAITFSVTSSAYDELEMTQESRFIAPADQLF
jgi:cytochrome c oxidase accessory protein FixG